MYCHKNVVLLALIGLFIKGSGAEDVNKHYAMSVASMLPLLEMESYLVENLKSYINELQSKIDIFEKILKKMIDEKKKYSDDGEKYLSMPLNSFSLIRRMHQDWPKMLKAMEQKIGVNQIANVRKMMTHLPNSLDLSESVNGIFLIQMLYKFNSKDMANGLLNGKQYNAQLSAIDCYSLASKLYRKYEFFAAIEWSYLTIDKMRNEDGEIHKMFDLQLSNVYQDIVKAFLWLNHYKEADLAVKSALIELPDNEILLNFQAGINLLMAGKLRKPRIEMEAYPFPSLCQIGRFGTSSNLLCRYNTMASAFLRLAPVKMEIIALDPYAVVFHDVIYDHEINEIKEYAMPNLKRSQILQSDSPDEGAYRILKEADLLNNHSATTIRINQRIADITGFVMSDTEKFKVFNYGVGGEYLIHVDSLDPESESVISKGNRVATMLIYLNDVEQGGLTIFPKININVRPMKGTALLWYNLDEAGDNNPMSIHAGCPVLVGSKWVIRKFISNREQTFRHPCPVRK